MKSSTNGNAIQHIKHHDIDMICGYLKELRKIKKELEYTQKALDNACDELSKHNILVLKLDKNDFVWKQSILNKQEWKEWCLKDDE